MKLISWGDADMINFYNHHNEFILPLASERNACGEVIYLLYEEMNCNFAVLFPVFINILDLIAYL